MEITLGNIYKVTIDDCCVEGNFTSKLVKAEISDENEVLLPANILEYGVILQFENGINITNYGGVELSDI